MTLAWIVQPAAGNDIAEVLFLGVFAALALLQISYTNRTIVSVQGPNARMLITTAQTSAVSIAPPGEENHDDTTSQLDYN